MAMKLTKERVNNRLHRLKTKPIENAGLIKKWERIARRLKENE